MFFRRRQFITHKGIQLRLGLVFVIWAIVLIVALFALFFMSYDLVSSKASQLGVRDEFVTKMLLIEQAKTQATYFGIAMMIFVVLMGLYIMAYAHRIVGPIHKMNLLLDKAIEDKDWPKPVKFRKKDAFHEFAQKFNRFVEVMKSK